MTAEEKIAYNKGGYREKYAMDNGEKKIEYWGEKEIWKWFYSPNDEYQDANGAEYDPEKRRWIG